MEGNEENNRMVVKIKMENCQNGRLQGWPFWASVEITLISYETFDTCFLVTKECATAFLAMYFLWTLQLLILFSVLMWYQCYCNPKKPNNQYK